MIDDGLAQVARGHGTGLAWGSRGWIKLETHASNSCPNFNNDAKSVVLLEVIERFSGSRLIFISVVLFQGRNRDRLYPVVGV